MKIHYLAVRHLLGNLAAVALFAFSGHSFGGGLGPLVDDFSDTRNNNLGVSRQFVDDTTSGGSTTTDQRVSEGILSVKGEIVPPRGQPGWASSVLLLDPQGLPRDASAFVGVRLLIKVNRGNISISANSTEVRNFDFHAAPVVVTSDGNFHEVKVPFASMRRAWSEQTPLNTSTISGLSIVAFDFQKGAFHFEVDEIGFY